MSKNLIVLLVLAVAIGGGVWYFWPVLWPASGGEVQISGSTEESSDALALVRRIEAITLDMSLFDDPDFLSLETVPAPSFDAFTQGRPNPFLRLVSSESQLPAKKR